MPARLVTKRVAQPAPQRAWRRLARITSAKALTYHD